MALINCAECGEQISSNAAACPKCGNPTNTALMQQQQAHLAQHQPAQMSTHQAQQVGESMAKPIIEHEQRKASGGATGALIGAALGYFLMASSCGFPETIEGFTGTLFIWSPVIGLGMLLGYFMGKAAS
jgi:hypothetical protein